MNMPGVARFKSMMSSESTKARAVRGSLWTILGHASSQGFRLLSNLILTRLLFPEVFGVMAIAQVIITGLIMFSDIGIIPSIVRSKNVEDSRFVNTAWTIQVIRNFLLWLITLAISIPVANFYQRPELSYLIPLAAISLLINGLFPIKVILASRTMNLFKVTVFQLAGQVAGSSLSILLAIYYKNALVFVAGTITTEFVRLILYRRYLPGKNNTFNWYQPAVAELIGFGKWIFLSSGCAFIAKNANVFILGKFLAPDLFGIYTVALVLALLPVTVCSMLNGKVLLPLFSEMGRQGASQQAIQKARYLVISIATAVTALLMLISPLFFSILYDERYSEAGYISLAVLVTTFPELLLIVTFNKLLVEGRGRTLAMLKLFHAVLLVITSLFVVEEYGIVGVCVATLVSGALAYLALLKVRGVYQNINAYFELCILLGFGVVSAFCIFLYSNGLSELLELSQ